MAFFCHETRRQIVGQRGPGEDSMPSGQSRGCGDDASESGRNVWRHSAGCWEMDGDTSQRRGEGLAGTTERAAANGRKAQRAYGAPDHTGDYRSLSGSVEAALRFVDTRSGVPTDSSPLWAQVVGFDHGPASAALGLYPAKAGAEGLRSRPGGRQTVAGGRIPTYSPPGESEKSASVLGRRDGGEGRPASRSLVCAEGQDPGNSRNRPAVWLQHDLGDHQSRPPVFHGLQTEIPCRRLSAIPQAAAQASGASTGLHYRRRSSGAPGQRGAQMDRGTTGTDRAVLSAGLPTGLESRRVPQQRHESQCRRATSRQESSSVDETSAVAPAQTTAEPRAGSSLLSCSIRHVRSRITLRHRCKLFNGRGNNGGNEYRSNEMLLPPL